MAKMIDAHQHFWEPRRGDYGWMPKDDPVLARRYSPADLAPTLERNGIAATVLVQAAPTLEETEYLLGIADATDSVAGVVGWVDFDDRGQLRQLERLKQHPKFVGVRPMIQDIPDVGWMLHGDIRWAFDALVDLGLTFDALGFPRHLANFLTVIERHPALRVVIDHCMKPEIRNHSAETFTSWAEGMSRLAGQTQAFCKLSGLVTEAKADWTAGDLAPYAQHVLSVFGTERVMWGSDWPVCQLRASYDTWFETAKHLCAGLGESEKDAVFGGTAAQFYGLSV